MSWVSPRTWTTGEIVSAAMMNGLRDALLESAPAKATTAGQLFRATGAGSIAALDIGSAGQQLRVNAAGTAPEWGGFVGARVYLTGGQNMSTATATVLSFTSERFDTASLHDTATNPSRITADRAGYWLATANVGWFANNVGRREISLIVNGAAAPYARVVESSPGTSAQTVQHVSAVLSLAATDYVEVQVYQDSGSTLAVFSSAPYSPEFSLHFLGS